MPKKLLTPCVMFLFLALPTVMAQDISNRITPSVTAPVITATASGERTRFTAPSTVVQMHLQIYTEAGQLLFDVSSKGNVLEWNLQGGSGERVPDGAYLCVVTVKSLSGRLSQRIGSVSVQQKHVELQPANSTPAQQQAVGPIEENGALTILKAGQTEATTVLANNGVDGQIIRDRGALSFRLGDFFSGTDQEQMRLTADGKLGIGTDNPQAKLDVAGTVRASEGIEFADGTVQTTGLSGRKDKDGNIVPAATGMGTQNRVAKWTDNLGTLGDSALFEASGNLGIGTTTPNVNAVVHADKAQNTGTAVFVTNNSAATGALASIRAGLDPANYTANYASLNILGANWPAGLGGTFLKGRTGLIESNGSNFGIGNINNTEPLLFYTTSARTERMRLTADGNFGIGTPVPTSVLHVVGPVPPPTVASGRGTDASPVLQVIGGNGGTTTDSQIGGTGAAVTTQAGTGGQGVFGGGTGGSVTTQAGNGGPGTGSFGGTGGGMTMQAGNGGPGPAGGRGGDVFVRAGNSSAGSTGFRGQGGSVTIQAGAGVGGAVHLLTDGGSVDVGNVSDFHLRVISHSNFGLRVATTTLGGNVASFGGRGDFTIDADGVGGGRLTVQENGNIGIGTASPGSRLHVSVPSSTNPISAMSVDVESFSTPANAIASHFFRVRDIFSGSPAAFLIRGDGNVGIGTDAPNAKVQVNNGDVYVGTGGNGMILKSPNGAICRRLSVDNGGSLSIAPVTCP